MKVTMLEIRPGVWRIREEWRDAEGKRQFRYTRVKGNKREAEKARASILLAQDQGGGAPPAGEPLPAAPANGANTVGQFADQWLAEIEAMGSHGINTLDTYRAMLARVKQQWGGVRISALTREDVVKGLGEQNKTASPRTVRHVHARLSALLTEAVKRGMIARNVAMGLKLPRVKRSAGVAMSDDQRALLLREVLKGHIGPVVRFVLGTGLRRGEVCGLRWGDFDPAKGTVRIARSIAQRGNGKEVWEKEPKTEQGLRVVTLPKSIADETRIRMEQDRVRWEGIGQRIEEQPMFLNAVGEMWKPGTLTRAIGGVFARCNLSQFTLHDLRHAHATELLRRGQNPRAVSERLGHANPSFTLDLYAQWLPHDDERLAEAIEGALK
jgi:integrase